jgi:hypothetical protein
MRRLRQKRHESGLAAERRDLVHRYMTDGTDASPAPEEEEELPVEEDPADVPLPLEPVTSDTATAEETDTASEPLPDSPPAIEVDRPQPVAPVPFRLEALGPSSVDGAVRMLEEVAGLCDELARLGAEGARRHRLLVAAGRKQASLRRSTTR